ncbi:hypothetical protein CBS101457_001917 [Exobasidium rhododendri]|nr:hypothetical protein CBS101457_001917 [Exobasidium rhododendri]
MASEDTTPLEASAKEEEPLFDPGLKKKKNKKLVDFDLEADSAGATSTQDAVVDDAAPADGDDMFDGMKKKSKKKKAIPMDLDEASTPSAPDAAAATEPGAATADAVPDADLDFGEMKKKKKKGKKGGFDLEAFEKELGEGEQDDAADLGDDPFAKDEDGEEGATVKTGVETWQGTDRDYTYQELLGRIFNTLRAQNPALSGDKKKYTIVPPVVQRDGSKKTMFSNVVDICRRMRRQPEHVIQFLFTELGTVGSVDGSQRLVIKGRFMPVQIEKVLRQYIVEYVTCKTCRSPQTLLTKENRIYFMTCESCGSTRSVATIKSGFQAQTGKRSKMRAQT